MKVLFSSGGDSKRVALLGVLLLMATQQVRPDFWTFRGKGQLESVALTRELPAVAARSGNAVQFIAEVSGNTVPANVAVVLRDKIATLLLNNHAGSIELVERNPDTIIKCILTGYEPKVVHQNQRQVGNDHLQIATWIGNIEASVQVLDARNRSITSGDEKMHLEKDYILSEKEDAPVQVTSKKKGGSIWDRAAAVTRLGASGVPNAADTAGAVTGNKNLHDALHESFEQQQKSAQPPTELEWSDMLVEGLAAKVANRIVPVDQTFTVELPLDKEFAKARDLAKAKHWGELEEEMEKTPPMQGSNEAYRLYMLGLSLEGQAYAGKEPPTEATEQLNKATGYYDDAYNKAPGEHEFLLARLRAQDSLDHYLEIKAQEKIIEGRSKAGASAEGMSSSGPKPDTSEASNAALISMVEAKMPEPLLLNYVQTVKDPKFDVSAQGLVELYQKNVPQEVIAAVQKRMSGVTAAPSTKGSAGVKRTSTVPQSH